MSHLDFFRKQAKNFLKDWRTQTKTVESDGFISYSYDWKFYDVGDIFFYYEFSDEDEQEITLARAQHLIAKMAGFKKWNDLIHATETEQTLAELLLRRFKDARDVQDWEEVLAFSGVAQYGAEAVLDYARHYYELGDAKEIVGFPADKITVLQGKPRSEALRQFDDEHNPAGSLRTDSTVFCTHCKKSFDFRKSKVIQVNDRHLTMVVCKNYPSCRGTYLDYKVLTPTLLCGAARMAELERGIHAFPHLAMDAKVHCIHCGKEYLYKEANAVIFPDDGEAYIVCKHYPECDGSLIDMMPAEKAGGEK
ncbi:MAG: hypothetical protein K2N58_05840 [Treponemataceae bacterium]|nr:hypothetical protein [Treponemataceae bacterium]